MPMASDNDQHEFLLHGEEAELRTRWVSGDVLRLSKRIDGYTVKEVVQRLGETVDLERIPVAEGDSGEIETLPDGSISIPVFEEQLVVEKRLVVRERLIIRKHTVVEHELVEADLKKERIDVEADAEVRARVAEG